MSCLLITTRNQAVVSHEVTLMPDIFVITETVFPAGLK